jgi:hypothetical protein
MPFANGAQISLHCANSAPVFQSDERLEYIVRLQGMQEADRAILSSSAKNERVYGKRRKPFFLWAPTGVPREKGAGNAVKRTKWLRWVSTIPAASFFPAQLL